MLPLKLPAEAATLDAVGFVAAEVAEVLLKDFLAIVAIEVGFVAPPPPPPQLPELVDVDAVPQLPQFVHFVNSAFVADSFDLVVPDYCFLLGSVPAAASPFAAEAAAVDAVTIRIREEHGWISHKNTYRLLLSLLL